MMKKFLSLCLIALCLVGLALPSYAEASGLDLAYKHFGGDQCLGGCVDGCATGCVTMVLNSILEVIPTKTVSLGGAYGAGFEDFASGLPFDFELNASLALGFEANQHCEVFPGMEFGLLVSGNDSRMTNFSLGNKVNYFPGTVNSKPYLTGAVNFCWNNGVYEGYLLETSHVYFRTNFGMGLKLTEQMRFEATYNMFLLGESTLADEETGQIVTSRLKNYLSFGLIFGRFTLPQLKKNETKEIKAKETETNAVQVNNSKVDANQTKMCDCDKDEDCEATACDKCEDCEDCQDCEEDL